MLSFVLFAHTTGIFANLIIRQLFGTYPRVKNKTKTINKRKYKILQLKILIISEIRNKNLHS